MELLLQRASSLETKEGRLKGLRFKPRSSDVLIVTPPKCGTTWAQQIVHQLRTGGDMGFREITEVIPCLESAYDVDLDLEAEQRANPRCYKTHSWYDYCPKGGRYIVIYREPCAAAYSFYNYLKGWFFQPGEVALDEFIFHFYLSRGKPKDETRSASYFEHLVSWWKHRNDPNVLWMFFEEMKEDLEGAVQAVASFLNINDRTKIQNAVTMSTFAFMKANEKKFDDNILAFHRNKFCGLPEGVTGSKVVTGSVDKAQKVLPENVKEAIQKQWQDVVGKETGFATYDELRIAFRKEKPLMIYS